MRISFIIIIVVFFCGNILSQEWNIYSNIDSLGNIIKSYDYITENEIKEIFDTRNFRIEEFYFENMSLLPMQVVSKDKIRLERVPFYEDQFLEISDLYFIGKIAIKDENLSHYLFANVMNKFYTKYFLFNCYKGKITSVIEICSISNIASFPLLPYRIKSKFDYSARRVILQYDYDDDYEDNFHDETKKISISDDGIIKLIEKIRH